MKKLMAILIGFLLVYLLAGCGSDIAPATVVAVTPAATPLVAATPSTVPPTTPLVTASGILEFPSGSADYAGDEQAPGHYKTPAWFSFPFTFETTQVFRGIAEGHPNLPPRQLLFWAVDPSVSVETTISQLRATPNVKVGPNQPVNVADLSGT